MQGEEDSGERRIYPVAREGINYFDYDNNFMDRCIGYYYIIIKYENIIN